MKKTPAKNGHGKLTPGHGEPVESMIRVHPSHVVVSLPNHGSTDKALTMSGCGLTISGKKSAGFTLVEILLVVAIIGALAAMVVPRLTGRSEKARAATARADIRANIATALKMYEIDMGAYPTTEQGLAALLAAPSGGVSWSGPYLERVPTDPWGRSYQYKYPGVTNPSGYDLYSFGHDGVEGTDDITNSQ